MSWSGPFSLHTPVCCWVLSIPAVSSPLLEAVQPHAELCSVSLDGIELSFLKFMFFWEYMRQEQSWGSSFGCQGGIAPLACGYSWASSGVKRSVAAFYSLEQTEFICREWSGCLWMRKWSRLMLRCSIYFTGASLNLQEWVSMKSLTFLGRTVELIHSRGFPLFLVYILPLISGCFKLSQMLQSSKGLLALMF